MTKSGDRFGASIKNDGKFEKFNYSSRIQINFYAKN